MQAGFGLDVGYSLGGMESGRTQGTGLIYIMCVLAQARKYLGKYLGFWNGLWHKGSADSRVRPWIRICSLWAGRLDMVWQESVGPGRSQ